MKLIAQKTR